MGVEHSYTLITRCAAEVRLRLGAIDRLTEEKLVRIFRAALRPRRRAGRKAEPETVKAARLWVAGMRRRGAGEPMAEYQRKLWQRIYREIWPTLAGMDRLTRQHKTATLRRNVKALLKRRRGRKSARVNTRPRQ